jgi:hypothetical protein
MYFRKLKQHKKRKSMSEGLPLAREISNITGPYTSVVLTPTYVLYGDVLSSILIKNNFNPKYGRTQSSFNFHLRNVLYRV